MVDTTVPTQVRVFTTQTADGKAVYISFLPNQTEPQIASPLFNNTLPDFDKTFDLPTQGA